MQQSMNISVNLYLGGYLLKRDHAYNTGRETSRNFFLVHERGSFMYSEPNADDIQAVIISQDIIEGISALTDYVNTEAVEVKINPRNFTCQKTGHIVGQRDENSLFSLMKIYGKDEFISILYHSVSLNTHPSWIYTTGENLDVLIEADPVGYACYCFSLITEQFYQTQRNLDRKRLPAIERHWAMARANALLVARGIDELPELNAELCRFLTYAPDTKAYLFKQIKEFGKSPDMLALLACSGELKNLLNEATQKALAGIGRASYAINGVDISDHRDRLKKVGLIDEIYRTPADAARGPSNIRKQRKSNRDIQEATLFGELRKMFGGLERRGMKSEGEFALKKWREKIASNDAFDVIKNDLEALVNFQLETIEAPNEAGENEVEVRTLARDTISNGASGGTEDQINQFIQISTKPLTLREKIAALKGAK